MKKLLLSMIIITAALIMGCEQFPTSYQRVEDTEIRMLDFIYEPVDIAPGDTVTLTAIFAGKNVDLNEYIDWYISFNVIRDIFGSETVLDSTTRLEPIAPPVTAPFSDNAQAVSFRIPIPNNVILESESIPTRWIEMLPPYLQNFVPPALAAATKTQMINMIESAAEANQHIVNQQIDPLILQLFTAPMRVTARVKSAPGRPLHRIVSSHSVRYNSRFESTGAPINSNPVIDSIVVYKVKGRDLLTFDYKTGKAEATFRLDIEDAIFEVEDGFSYFIEAHTENSIDTTITADGNRIPEKHIAHWFFAHDKDEIAGVRHTDFMDFRSFMGNQWSLVPPKNRRLEKFTLWVTVHDEALNERMRPMGSTLKEISGRFVYK